MNEVRKAQELWNYSGDGGQSIHPQVDDQPSFAS